MGSLRRKHGTGSANTDAVRIEGQYQGSVSRGYDGNGVSFYVSNGTALSTVLPFYWVFHPRWPPSIYLLGKQQRSGSKTLGQHMKAHRPLFCAQLPLI
jgi:hypothetical protein